MYYLFPSYGRQPVLDEQRMMTVTGTGTVSVEPNVANIQLGVVTQDESLTEAQQENSETMNQVIQAILQLSIAQEHIQTVEYSISPQYDYVDGEQIFRGYQVSHMISITVENIEQTGTVIDTAVQHGANRVSTIQLTVREPQRYYEEALRIALINATSKAETVAETMQLTLDPSPVKIVEKTRDTQQVAAYSLATPIEPGQLDIIASVEVQFQYGG